MERMDDIFLALARDAGRALAAACPCAKPNPHEFVMFRLEGLLSARVVAENAWERGESDSFFRSSSCVCAAL
jgi:hypothetical protein